MKFIIIFITFCLNSSASLFTNNNGFRQIAIRNQKIINKNKLRYIIDIDGTICTKTKSDYPKTNPIYEKVKFSDLLTCPAPEFKELSIKAINFIVNFYFFNNSEKSLFIV